MNRHNVLFIGMSSIVTRRALPAVLSLDDIGVVHVASRRPYDFSPVPESRRGSYWDDYEAALSECEPCTAYISLPNAMHAYWVRAALERGFHVIVDKPAVLGHGDAVDALIGLARQKSLVLAEATVWPSHPIADQIRSLASRAGGPLAAMVTFTSPPMDSTGFRYSQRMGGGALLDRGSYAASCGRLLFGEPPTDVACRVLSRVSSADGVDLSFSAVLRYPGGVLMGYFSLESEYQNRIDLIGQTLACVADRVFTPPADHEGIVSVRERDSVRQLRLPAGDSFARFIKGVLDAIDNRDFVTHSEMLRQDARVMERLLTDARGGDE